MERWRPFTQHYLTYFDGCGFGKYWVIWFHLALLMPLKPSHNLLVRGSNPCGGTNTKSCVTSAPRFSETRFVVSMVRLRVFRERVGFPSTKLMDFPSNSRGR